MAKHINNDLRPQITVKQTCLTNKTVYRVTGTVDTTIVKVGEMMSEEEVNQYCHDHNYRIEVCGQDLI